MLEFTPKLPPHWEHFIGIVPIVIEDNLTWDEDIFSARWEGWNIWIDGGKGISTWQCSLLEPSESRARRSPKLVAGELKYDGDYLMRDFLDTPEQVQAWLDRAVVAARKAHEQDAVPVDAPEPEVTQASALATEEEGS